MRNIWVNIEVMWHLIADVCVLAKMSTDIDISSETLRDTPETMGSFQEKHSIQFNSSLFV